MASPIPLGRLDTHFHLPDGLVFNLNTDTSGAEVYASAGPRNNETWYVTRLIGIIEDTKINAGDYGAIGSGLTNGIDLIIRRGGTQTHSFMEGHRVKTSAGWAHFCHDASRHAWGAGNEFVTFRWTFAKEDMLPIILDGVHRDSMGVLLNDDMSGLITHAYIIQGSMKTEVSQIPQG